MTRAEILDAARAAVTTDRNSTYGEPEESFQAVAAIWYALDQARGARSRGPADVALYLAALKMVRATSNPAHADSWVDLAGYAACGGEIAARGSSDMVGAAPGYAGLAHRQPLPAPPQNREASMAKDRKDDGFRSIGEIVAQLVAVAAAGRVG